MHNQPPAEPKHTVSLIHDLKNLILAEMLDHIEDNHHIEDFRGAVAQKRKEVAGHNRVDS